MSPSAEQSSQILKVAKDALDKLNIPFCLFLGTALGAYRDGTFCGGDTDDIDIAVDIKYFNRLEEIKQTLGIPVTLEWNPDGLCPEVSFKHKWSSDPRHYTKVDIFFITEIDGRMCWRFYLDETGSKFITKSFAKKHWDTWDMTDFFGEEYNIPGYIEEYLTANYGDWRTPIHRDKWNWQTDNLCVSV